MDLHVVDGLTTPPAIATAPLLAGGFRSRIVRRRPCDRAGLRRDERARAAAAACAAKSRRCACRCFKTIYSPLKQLDRGVLARQRIGLQTVVLVEARARGYSIGFLTKEFTIDRGKVTRAPCWRLRADQQPVSRRRHCVRRDRAMLSDIAVEEGIRACLSHRHVALAADREAIIHPFVRGDDESDSVA